MDCFRAYTSKKNDLRFIEEVWMKMTELRPSSALLADSVMSDLISAAPISVNYSILKEASMRYPNASFNVSNFS